MWWSLTLAKEYWKNMILFKDGGVVVDADVSVDVCVP